MGKLRNRKIQSLIDLNLPRCVGDVIISPNDMGDLHQMVIDDYSKIVGGHTVGFLDYKIIQHSVFENNLPPNQVIDLCGPHIIGTKADYRLASFSFQGLSFGIGKLGTAPVVFRISALGQGFLSSGLQLLRGAVAEIGLIFI